MIKQLYRKPFLRKIFQPIIFFVFRQKITNKIINYYNYHLISNKKFIKKRYFETFGELPDLINPKTINEKIQWLKLYERSTLHKICADKFLVRKHIKTTIGKEYLIPLIYKTNNVNSLKFENLPKTPIAIKTNHDSSGAFLIRNMNDNNIEFNEIKIKLKAQLKNNHFYSSREWQYKKIKPLILVEKLLLCDNNKVPNDFKIHCFNGIPKIVYVSIDREGSNKRNIYDINWNPLYFTWAPVNKDISNLRGNEIEKPRNYNLMIQLAKKLSKPFKYVRVDLLNVDGRIYFGELTFHHGEGLDIIKPKKWDYILGEMLDLNIN